MKPLFVVAGIAGFSLLTACGDGTPFEDDGPVPVGTAVLADGVYTVTQGDSDVELAADDSIPLSGNSVWLAPGDRAQAYESDNVLAIGGVLEDGTPFAGITGIVRDAPAGDATFEGGFAVLQGEDGYNAGDLTLNFDLETGALTNDGGDLTVDATATEIGMSGTVTYDGQNANLLGNFYGTDEVAGAFTGDEIGGVIYGTQQ